MALCENSVLKLSTRIYGPTTIGPGSKAGGEVKNPILFAYSNKAHDGFPGNSIWGEWCNPDSSDKGILNEIFHRTSKYRQF
ncbi:MAG: hypothetical protein ACQER7_02760 [Bacteroidota bacterium]